MLPAITVQSVLRGRVQPFGPPAKKRESAIAKRPVDAPVRISKTGLAGDDQADRKHHGGPEKAVHHYAIDHYPYWREKLPGIDVLEGPGAFGENISTLGWTENEVCVGDVIRLGTAIVQVSQGRQPCWKLGFRFGDKRMPLRLQETGFTGWYYRVLEEGMVQGGDALEHLERPAPEWPLDRIAKIIYGRSLDAEELHGMASLELLSENWRNLATKRLKSGAVEDWRPRVSGVD